MAMPDLRQYPASKALLDQVCKISMFLFLLSYFHLIRLKFLGYRSKSDIDISAWKVTWNFTYIPFNPNFGIIVL